MANILIIKLGALGDVVMATSLIRQIQEQHMDDNVFLLTAPEFTHLFTGWYGLDVYSFPRKGVAAFIQTLGWIRSQKFSAIYDLQSNDRSGLFCSLSGVARRIGNHPRFPYHLHPKEKWVGQCHIYERMLDVLRAAGINACSENPSLPISDKEETKVNNWLRGNNLEAELLVVIHAGASPQHPQKRWPYFAKLAPRLKQAGYTVIWIGTKIDEALNKELAKSAGIDASNVFSIPELVVLAKRARFAITNDSGPMHILACCGIPVYGLFGPTNWRRNHGVGQRANVICVDTSELSFTPSDLNDLKTSAVLGRLNDDGLI